MAAFLNQESGHFYFKVIDMKEINNTNFSYLTKINFIKMSGAGNDFVIIDARKENYQFNPQQIAKLSQRNNIGCDQFIVMRNSKNADIFMDIFNSDGSSSGACGNATRCVALLIMEEFNLHKIVVETKSGLLECQKKDESILVNMGKPKFNWQEIPLQNQVESQSIHIDNFDFFAVNMGNPHIVTFLQQDLDDEIFFKVGPELENHSLFPQKTNVEFARKIAPNHFKVRVWERGAGETLACGSGACAVGVAALKKGLAQNNIEVQTSFKGGDIFISLNEKGEVIMRGEATKIFYGIIDENFL